MLRHDVESMHEHFSQVCRQLNLELPPPLLSSAPLPGESKDAANPRNANDGNENTPDSHSESYATSPILDTPYAVHAPVNAFNGDLEREDGGARTLFSDTQRLGHKAASDKDLISLGLVTLEKADVLVQRYLSLLDPSLYGIARHYKSLHEIREASPALLAAICTVSALHEPNDDRLYGICLAEFRRLFAASLFTHGGGVEYLRALCIASFWLLDDARMLMSDAVRRAADMRIHGYFYQVIGGSFESSGGVHHMVSQQDARDRIRLWYLIFICDHHLSILDNRDGLLRHDKAVLEDWDAFLGSQGAQELDIRIMSQVSLLIILNDIRDNFGGDGPLKPLQKSRVVQLNHFVRQLDDWQARIATMYGEFSIPICLFLDKHSWQNYGPR